MMGGVRPLAERDIPRVVELHRRVFVPRETRVPVERHAYFREIFFGNPWSGMDPPSLVYEDTHGELVGFLGVMCRQMSLTGRPIRAAITAHFVVEPTRRSTLAGIELVRALLSGPQDLTLADEASETSRKLWEGLGGTIALLYSFYWVRLLRPAEFAVVHRWGTGRRPAARMWIPLSRAVDAVLRRSLDGLFRVPMPVTSGEELDGDTLATCVAEFTRGRALRPEYDGPTATGLLEILARKPGCETLRKVLVRTAAGEIAGWYLYCGRPGGVGEVLQVGAREGQIGDVLDHLFAQAWRDGAVALVGRIDPRFAGALSARGCFFHHRGHSMLIHAKDSELLQAIQRGDAFFSRLEGEWYMRFQGEYS